MMSVKEWLVEGDFYFSELIDHLKEWKSPMYVHVHLDDTRINNRIEYDPYTDWYVGFVLPLREGLPVCDSFIFDTFVGIKDPFHEKSLAKYAHCIVVKSIEVDVPSFVLAVLGTDYKYNHTVITKQWQHVEKELTKKVITVISNRSDGAAPFLKAMLSETKLFTFLGNSF